MQRYLKDLDLGEIASWNEIKTQYIDQLKVWHPDRFSGDERLRLKAEERSKTINLAYTALQDHLEACRDRGLSFDLNAPFLKQCEKEELQSIEEAPEPEEDLVSSLVRSQNYEQEGLIQGKDSGLFFLDEDEALEQLHLEEARSWMMGGVIAIVALTGILVVMGFVNSGKLFPEKSDEDYLSKIPRDVFIEDSLDEEDLSEPATYKSVKNPHLDSLISGSEGAERIISGIRKKSHRKTAPIFKAASRCDVKSVIKYLNKGVAVNVTDDDGMSPLSWAAKRNCEGVAKLLVARGANLNHVSSNGFTPLAWAKWFKHIRVMRVLELEADTIKSNAARNRRMRAKGNTF